MAKLEGGDSIDRLILAMACCQMTKRGEAQSWFAQAIDRVELGKPTHYHDMGPLAVHQLREEAETMIFDNETD
jgi:hypothetical protein